MTRKEPRPAATGGDALNSGIGAPVKRLVLAGGGHAHLAVLLALARAPLRGVEVTLITPTSRQAYSGMLPGWIAGHYARADLEIDLEFLSRRANVTLLRDRVAAMDANRRCIALSDGSHLEFDLLSLDVGSAIDVSRLEALGERLLPLRPLEDFLERWPSVLAEARADPRFRIAVVGAGAAGIEVALAVRHAFDRERIGGEVCLMAPRDKFLIGHGPGARRRLAGWVQRAGVVLHDGHAVGERDGLLLADGSTIPAACVIAATGAAAPRWLGTSGLELDPQGYVAVDSCHRSFSHGNVFAAGDVSSRESPYFTRSGVHAVRAGPVLAANLAAALSGGRLREYHPRRRSLYLLACGPRSAVVSWGSLSLGGEWAWRWKDRIDRGFVGRHSVVP
jgi:pyridine nucleotide-disulfide oxidoreductase family protein